MRPSILAFVLPSLFVAAMPACAGLITPDLAISLVPNTEAFYVTGATTDPGDCLSEYCALFSGTLTDNDTDGSVMSLNPTVTIAFATTPASDSLTVDNTSLHQYAGPTVEVVPEPSAASLLRGGFWQGVKRAWCSSEASR
jgi:hypothetical protein